jgi:hypothetical protein
MQHRRAHLSTACAVAGAEKVNKAFFDSSHINMPQQPTAVELRQQRHA